MRIWITAAALLSLSVAAFGQRHKLAAINTESPQGKLLQQALQEQDAAKRIAAYEQFITDFPQDKTIGWVLTQIQQAYLKMGNHDKAMQAGEKLLALDPDDVEAAFYNLKAAEAKKDPDLVIKWSAAAAPIAKKAVAAKKPEDMEDEDWKQALEFAKGVGTYTEYALYSTALQVSDSGAVMRLVEELEKRNEQSQYLPQVLGRFAGAARQANALDRLVAVGERAVSRNQLNEDVLLALADYYMNRKEPDKAVEYALKVPEFLASKPKPEGFADADWEKKKNTSIGLAHWMAGVALAGQSKWAPADKELRAALPLIGDNDQLKAGALFYLGLANYRMGKATKNRKVIDEALRFSQQAAAIKGPYAGQAANNVKVIKSEYGIR